MDVFTLDHVALNVKDRPAMMQFLESVLGLRPKDPNATRVLYPLGSTTLVLFEAKGEVMPSQVNHLAFTVADYEGELERLRQAGFSVHGDFIDGPEGLVIQLARAK